MKVESKRKECSDRSRHRSGPISSRPEPKAAHNETLQRFDRKLAAGNN